MTWSRNFKETYNITILLHNLTTLQNQKLNKIRA